LALTDRTAIREHHNALHYIRNGGKSIARKKCFDDGKERRTPELGQEKGGKEKKKKMKKGVWKVALTRGGGVWGGGVGGGGGGGGCWV